MCVDIISCQGGVYEEWGPGIDHQTLVPTSLKTQIQYLSIFCDILPTFCNFEPIRPKVQIKYWSIFCDIVPTYHNITYFVNKADNRNTIIINICQHYPNQENNWNATLWLSLNFKPSCAISFSTTSDPNPSFSFHLSHKLSFKWMYHRQ